MANITVKNLSKQYKGGEVQALRELSFECPDGKFFCLLGPAGAGKTTTIKLIAGIEPADQGQIFFDNEDVSDYLPRDRDVAVAFETYALYPQRTVRDNLKFPLQAPGRKGEWPAKAVEARAEEIANLLGIGELLDRYPRQLSGGQRQRVALGRALVRKPKAYLLDEPIAHLDAKLRHRMRGELKRIQIELGITTIFTTPDQLEALSLSDIMAVINNGQIEQIGSPDEIFRRPANVFVARFVGDPPMNILHADIDGEDLMIKGFIRLAAPALIQGLRARQVNGSGVLVGIRPKDIQLIAQDSEKALAKAEARHVQILGETSVVTLKLDSLELRAKLATQQAVGRGENVGLSIEHADFHFFDPGTERRIDVRPEETGELRREHDEK